MTDKPISRGARLDTSWLRRSARAAASVAGFSARIGVGAIRRLGAEDPGALRDEHFRKGAEHLRDSLGNLKGLLMKVGQTLSYVDMALPESARNALAALQHSAEPFPPEVVDAVVEQELGAPPTVRFARWDPEPIAAASIGQVHRARLHGGQEVAVKIQYPGIRKALTADLRNVRVLNMLGGLVARHVSTPAALAELRDRFLEECDYRHEADNQRLFREYFADRDDILVPEVFPEHSSERVLTTSYVEGARFAAFLASATPEQRNWAGGLIHRFAFEPVFRRFLFNCDPHPGNYLFRDGQIAFLDFGCVKHFRPDLVAIWKDMIRAALARDLDRFADRVVDTGYAPTRKGFDFDYHYKMYLFLLRPWLHDRPYRLTHEYISRSFEVLIARNPNRFRTGLPADFVFVNRLQWGLYSVLAMLGAECNWREQALDLLYEPGEPRPPAFRDDDPLLQLP